MKSRFHPWLLAVSLFLVCAAALALLHWFRTRPALSLAEQLPYLPSAEAPVFYFDAGVLRRSGLLRLFFGNASSEEADYRSFVEATGFDYREDLDSLLASFGEENTYILATGQFDWARLSNHVRLSGGYCSGVACSLKSTGRPGRFISFSRLRTGVLAIAVSKNSLEVQTIFQKIGKAWSVPSEPVWVWLPAGRLKPAPGLPPGVGAYLSTLEGARSASFALGGSFLEFEVRLRAEAPDEAFARQAAEKLTQTTANVVSLLAREKQRPNPDDLSGVLSAGKFRADGKLIFGVWPVPRAALNSILN